MIGYLVEKLRNKDLFKDKEQLKTITKGASNGLGLRLNARSR